MLRRICLIFTVAGILAAAAGYANRPVVLLNGRILTMDSDNTVVTTVGFQFGKIQATGDEDEVIARMSRLTSWSSRYAKLFGTRYVDLHGQTMIPGFVDAHSHFPASGIVNTGMDLSSPPFGVIRDVPELLQKVTRQTQQQSHDRWIIGFNYDDAALDEQRHPTRAELDTAAPNHAVYLRHRSGHMGVANSRALQDLGNENRDDQQRLNGLLQEKAAPGMSRLLQEIPWWRFPDILFTARDNYLRAGVTFFAKRFCG